MSAPDVVITETRRMVHEPGRGGVDYVDITCLCGAVTRARTITIVYFADMGLAEAYAYTQCGGCRRPAGGPLDAREAVSVTGLAGPPVGGQ